MGLDGVRSPQIDGVGSNYPHSNSLRSPPRRVAQNPPPDLPQTYSSLQLLLNPRRTSLITTSGHTSRYHIDSPPPPSIPPPQRPPTGDDDLPLANGVVSSRRFPPLFHNCHSQPQQRRSAFNLSRIGWLRSSTQGGGRPRRARPGGGTTPSSRLDVPPNERRPSLVARLGSLHLLLRSSQEQDQDLIGVVEETVDLQDEEWARPECGRRRRGGVLVGRAGSDGAGVG